MSLAKLIVDAGLPSYSYYCKKTGETTTVDIAQVPVNSIIYAFAKGLGEYLDNYHASETLKKHGDSQEKVAAAVKPMVEEAHKRFMAGDVPRPGQRGSGPVMTEAAAEAHLAKTWGVSVEQLRAIKAAAAPKAPEPAPVSQLIPKDEKKKKAS